MKNRRKRLLALVLVLILTISMSATAFAAVRISRKSITIAVNAPRWLHVKGYMEVYEYQGRHRETDRHDYRQKSR